MTAVQVHILKGEKAGDWWKFTVNVISVYKQGESRIRRGDQLLWVRAKDIACKCPKIKSNRKYLLLANYEEPPGQSGTVADKSSLVIQWRDTWARRLRKFQQREKKGKFVIDAVRVDEQQKVSEEMPHLLGNNFIHHSFACCGRHATELTQSKSKISSKSN
ncbi:hypothetical protein DNTS_034989 [Danionella cerebrum]|uniref:NTR domain-containing protein n=1 Tax=Danionella cerebrum TaxID=2873325 RepID=A0A553MTA4_9TELE|nr:hypothetical protein DNTS_034989 [Danionella translucida]